PHRLAARRRPDLLPDRDSPAGERTATESRPGVTHERARTVSASDLRRFRVGRPAPGVRRLARRTGRHRLRRVHSGPGADRPDDPRRMGPLLRTVRAAVAALGATRAGLAGRPGRPADSEPLPPR